MATHYYRHLHIYIDDVDISSLVRDVRIDAMAGALVETTITILGHPTIDTEGNIRLTTRDRAILGPLQTPHGPMRGIHFRVEEDDVEKA